MEKNKNLLNKIKFSTKFNNSSEILILKIFKQIIFYLFIPNLVYHQMLYDLHFLLVIFTFLMFHIFHIIRVYPWIIFLMSLILISFCLPLIDFFQNIFYYLLLFFILC